MNLKNVKHINKFRRLPYPKNEMLIVGPGVVALLGLRDNKDIDVWTTKNVISKVSKDKNFIEKVSKLDKNIMYESKDGSIEMAATFPTARKSFKENLKIAVVVYGIHFQNPKEVLEWKKRVNRPKDKFDIMALEKYLSGNLAEYYLNAMWMLR